MSPVFQQEPLIVIGLAAVIAFYCGALARRLRLPSIIGFMILGVIFGPSGMRLLETELLDHLSFITEISLGFVAFAIGAELSMRSLRSLGRGIISIILAESFGAFAAVALAVYLLTRSWPVAVLFGAVAPASAPAGTVAVIQEYRARGPLTKALYAVVGFDDGLAILIFGFAAALSRALLFETLGLAGGGEGLLNAMRQPVGELTLSIVVGTLLGVIFLIVVRRLEAPRDMLIMIFGFVVFTTGVAEKFHFSLILTNMTIGFILVNLGSEPLTRRVTAPLHDVMPLVFLLFFTLAGAHLRIDQLPRLGILGLVYIAGRSAGLIGGARLGAMIGHVPVAVRRYVGLGILSQAGVAIGLSLIVHQDMTELMQQSQVRHAVAEFARSHPGISPNLFDPLHIAGILITTITATCIFFEIVGPILTRFALLRAGEISTEAPRPSTARS